MAIDIKLLLKNALLELCRERDLSKITIKELQEKSGVSRQSFYNHFHDMADLIQYTYTSEIVIHWNPNDKTLDFCDYLIQDLSMTKKYHYFLKKAYRISGQNCLKDYMTDYCIAFDKKWIQTFYGTEQMPALVESSVLYHSVGTMYMKINWVLSDMPCTVHELAKTIIINRHHGISPLVWNRSEDSPYFHALEKITHILATQV